MVSHGDGAPSHPNMPASRPSVEMTSQAPKKIDVANPFGVQPEEAQPDEKPAAPVDPNNPYANEPPILEGKYFNELFVLC